MNKLLNWIADLIPDGPIRFRPDIDGPKLIALKEAEDKLWLLANDIRCGNGKFETISLNQRLLMCSGVEYSIQTIQSMIKEIENLPK